MLRRALAVVPEHGRYVCATVLEDGQMRVRIVDDWKEELAEEEKDLSFRVLVPPEVTEDLDDKPYYVWEAVWTPFDQNHWMEYFQKVVKGGVELPGLLLQDLEFATRCLKARGAKDWTAVQIKDNPRFSKLSAVLLAFKALAELRQNKLCGIEVNQVEREGEDGNPKPGEPIQTYS